MKKYRRVDTHYHVAHLLGPRVIRDKPQRVWVAGHRLFANLLYFKTISSTRQKTWFHMHCFVAHLLHQVIRDIAQLSWVYLNTFNTYLLNFKMVRNKKNAAGLMHTALSHISCVLY